MKTCPYCAEQDLQDAATVCKHCGKDIAEAEKPYYERNINFAPVLGLLLLLGGMAAVAFFFAVFKTSVDVPTQQIMGETIGGGSVNNLGLMQDRQNGILIGVGAAVVGVLLILVGQAKRN